jgi:MFS family permease
MAFGQSILLDERARTNFHHLYADLAWFGVLTGSSMAFLGIFLARLGANSFTMGLYTAGPGLVNLFFSLPAGRWLEGKPLVSTTFHSSVLFRLGYLAVIPLPWILANPGQIWGVIWITLLMSIPATLLAIAFNALFADAVSPEWRVHVVGRRNALFAVMVTVTSLVCGLILDRVAFPLNYQIVFLVGGVSAMLSSYHLGKIYLPYEPPARLYRSLGSIVREGQHTLSGWLPHLQRSTSNCKNKPLLRLDLLRGPFGPFMLVYMLFYTFQYVVMPLFPLYNVHDLHLTDGNISLGTALFYIVMMATSLGINRVSSHRSHRFMLVTGALLFGAFPFIDYLAKDATLFLVANAVGGAIWAVLNAGLVNRLMERVPEDDRPAHMALHNVSLNLGILIGSMLGPLLAIRLGVKEVLLIGAVLRFSAGLLMLVWG